MIYRMIKRNHESLLLLRLFLGGVLIYAGVLKMLEHPQVFADAVEGFQLVPRELVNLVALSLPPFEILLGAMLILPAVSRSFNKSISQSAALAAVCLFAAFAFALAQAMLRGIEVDCGCFGGGPSWLESFSSIARAWFSLLRALALCLASLWLWRRLARGCKGQ